MEQMEPKVRDRIAYGGRITTIEAFDEDNGTYLRSGAWVCMSEFEKNEDGVWVMRSSRARVFQIGEKYSNRSTSRKGATVIRAAVYEGGLEGPAKVITSSPCCPLDSRRLDFDDITSSLAEGSGGWSVKCTQCGWHYKVLLEHTGDPRLGLYGVRWISEGF